MAKDSTKGFCFKYRVPAPASEKMLKIDNAQRHADGMIRSLIESLMYEHEIDALQAIRHVKRACEKYVEGL